MPDITMCKGNLCQKKYTCHRYLATPSFHQSWFHEPPINIETGECEYYWSVVPEEDYESIIENNIKKTKKRSEEILSQIIH